MKPFTQTYLYIKQHAITKKLYFGKTTKDPEKYNGSGKYWTKHIKKHGLEHVQTLWYCLFLDKESIQEFALNFSKQENIIVSEEWLNLKFEDGLDGGMHGLKQWNTGIPHKQSTKDKISLSRIGKPSWNKGIPMTEECKQKQRESHKGKKASKETKLKMSLTRTGKKRGPYKERTCPHCGLIGSGGNMARSHFDNCKLFQ